MYRCGSLFDSQIHTASSVINNFNVYEDGNRNQKESTFQICNKEQFIFHMWIYTHSASICLMTYSRCRQLCHTPSICLTWREVIAAKFRLPFCCPPKILPYFATHGIYNPCVQMSKNSSVLLPSGIRNPNRAEKYSDGSFDVRTEGSKMRNKLTELARKHWPVQIWDNTA